MDSNQQQVIERARMNNIFKAQALMISPHPNPQGSGLPKGSKCVREKKVKMVQVCAPKLTNAEAFAMLVGTPPPKKGGIAVGGTCKNYKNGAPRVRGFTIRGVPRKESQWIKFLKAVQADRGYTYCEALAAAKNDGLKREYDFFKVNGKLPKGKSMSMAYLRDI